MKVFSVKCPSCGASIEINDNSEKTECEFCHSYINISRLIPSYKPIIKKEIVYKENKSNYYLIVATAFLIVISVALFFTFFANYQKNLEYNSNQVVYTPEPIIAEEKTGPKSALDIGTWIDEHTYINEKLGIKINVPKGWSFHESANMFIFSEFRTGNFVHVGINKYRTAEDKRKFEASQGKPRGEIYRINEEQDTEEFAGETYLTYYYDYKDKTYYEKYYYRDFEWEFNEWSRGDDSLEIRCRVYKDSQFDLNQMITSIEK
jgi:hypothetical protein